MKTKLAVYLLVTLFASSCGSKPAKEETTPTPEPQKEEIKEVPKLYITTTTAIKKKTDKEAVKKLSTSVVDTDYFEIGLYLMGDEKSYQATKTVHEITDPKEFTYEFFKITDEKGEIVNFQGSTEFLNYMSSKGYDMKDQHKEKYHTDYTFKKK